mgnify:CR=1 FL=1
MATVALKSIIETPIIANIRESANHIWLAGLGAYAKTQEEGEKLFQSLVKEGEKVEKQAKKIAEARFESNLHPDGARAWLATFSRYPA